MNDVNRVSQTNLVRALSLIAVAGPSLLIAVACSQGGGGSVPAPRAAGVSPAQSADGRQEYDADGHPIPPQRTETRVERRTLERTGGAGRAGSWERRDVDDGFVTSPGAPQGPQAPARPDAPPPAPVVRVEAPAFDPGPLTIAQLFAGSDVARAVRRSTLVSARQAPLFYSQAGRDDMYTTMLWAVRRYQGEDRFAANRVFAEQIGNTKLFVGSRNAAGGQFELAIRMGETGRLAIIRGQLNRERRGHGAEINGFDGLTARVTCLDAGADCQVAFVRLRNQNNYVAYFITRNQLVQTRLGSARRIEENLAYGRVAEMLVRSSTNPTEFNRAGHVGLYTTEVIGGRASFAFGVRVLTSEGEFAPGSLQAFGVEGLLLKEETSPVSLLDLVPRTELAAIGSNAHVRSRLSDSIRGGSLVRNDGRGTLEILMGVGDPGARTDNLVLVLSTYQPAIARDVQL